MIDSNENRGLVIADTNSTITKAYYDYYFPTDQPHQDAFNRLYELTADEEKWEAIIFVNPTGEYVNDGFRDMTMAGNEIRNQFTNHLKELIKQYHPNIPVYEIGGDYLENYTKAIEIIDGFYRDF